MAKNSEKMSLPKHNFFANEYQECYNRKILKKKCKKKFKSAQNMHNNRIK